MAIDKKDATRTCYGYFTLEKFLLGKTLPEIENLLGYENGRLHRGAAFFLIDNPSQVADFSFMGTSQFPEHQVRQKPWLSSLNTDGRKEVHLGTFMQERLIKVYPVSPHDEWICRHLNTEQTYMYQRISSQLSKMSGDNKLNELLKLFEKWPEVQEQIKSEYNLHANTNQSDKILDKVYPPNFGSKVMQWKLNLGIKGRLVCELSNASDRYYPRF